MVPTPMLYLIDIDGTLLLSGGAGNRALDQAFSELHGVAEAMRTIRPAGKTDPLIVAEAFRTALGREPNGAEIEAIVERYLVHLPETLADSSGFRLLAGVPEGLDRLGAQGHLLGLATGNVEAGARLKVQRGGLSDYFSYGGYGDACVDRAAMVAEAARRGAERLGRDPSPDEIIVVGDTARDVAAAHANGFRAVAVHSGTVARETLEAAGPEQIVTSLLQL